MSDIIIYNTWADFINHDNYKEYFLDNNTIWINTLEEVKNYIDTYHKKPPQQDKDSKIKTLGCWLSLQLKNYKTKDRIMSDNMIYNTWTNFINDDMYKKYFMDNNTIWLNTLEEVKSYINTYYKRPPQQDKDSKIKTLGIWLSTQITNYKTKNRIMSDIIIYDTWANFINDDNYKEYFLNNNTMWMDQLEEVKNYINIYHKRPVYTNKDIKIKTLGCWLLHQVKNYKTKKHIMSDNMIYNTWTNFINDDMYKEYFMDNNTIWLNTLEEVKQYINTYQKRPSRHDKDYKIKTLGNWLQNQVPNYKTKKDIMKEPTIYDTWTNFINDGIYKEYFYDNNTIWFNTLEKVKQYILMYQKCPSSTSEDSNIKTLGCWLLHQVKNYKTKKHIISNNIIYDTWTHFINHDIYKEYFK